MHPRHGEMESCCGVVLPCSEDRQGDTRVLATCVLPLPFPWMVRAGLGRDRVHQTEFKRGKLEVLVERIYAKKVIGKRTESPTGELAREAVLALLERVPSFEK